MSPPLDTQAVLVVVRKSGLIKEEKLESLLKTNSQIDSPTQVLEKMVQANLLTDFQARHLLKGKYKGLILGSYKILKPLAKGGMGLVYLAEHTRLQRLVALKICMTDRVGKGAEERFNREARALAALDHPNIVRVHDFGSEGKTHYLVMDYVEGLSLEEILHNRKRLPFREAVGYAIQAAQGLKHAHERGLIHRDVKPANLLLDHSGTIKLLDMGLARFYSDNEDNLTERLGGNVILGSPDYISPEQALNRLDNRSDIYSLGATLYALIAGRPPFPGKTTSIKLLSHQMRIPPSLHSLNPEIPEELSKCVQRMLAKDPNARYQTPAEVIRALTSWGPSNHSASAVADTVVTASVGTESSIELPMGGANQQRSGTKFKFIIIVTIMLATLSGVTGWVLKNQAQHQSGPSQIQHSETDKTSENK